MTDEFCNCPPPVETLAKFERECIRCRKKVRPITANYDFQLMTAEKMQWDFYKACKEVCEEIGATIVDRGFSEFEVLLPENVLWEEFHLRVQSKLDGYKVFLAP
jgi:hypothetical protein